MDKPEVTPEQLEALSKAASPALGVSVKALAQLFRLGAEHQRPRADNWDTFPAEQDAEFVCTLVNLYRQGQLVAVDDAAVDRVARAIHEDHSAIPWDATCQQDISYRAARAAIAAMGGK